MPWPLSQDYNEAVQDPAVNFADPDLCQGQATTNALGLPMPCSGNFADVYHLHGPGGDFAVKCFTREVPGLRKRYAAISAHMGQARLPFAVEFRYMEQGIRVHGRWYPALKMDWVEGLLLNAFVRDNLDRPAVLDALGQLWVRMARRLRAAGVAHGDLQHGNVLLVPDRASSLLLKLIDYDGMWVPALAGRRSGEVGHPAYQHPQRLREASYGPEVDRFPLLVVAAALRCLRVGGRGLWERYDNGDNLLFKAADFADPHHSPLFAELLQLPGPEARSVAARLIAAAQKPLEATPLLEDVFPEGPVGPTAVSPVRAAPAPAVLAPAVPPAWVASLVDPVEPPPGSTRNPAQRKKPALALVLAGAMVLVAFLVAMMVLISHHGASDSEQEQALGPGSGRTNKTRRAHLDKEGKVRTLLGHSGCIRGVVFLPDGRRALSGSSDKTARLWDLETGQELRRFTGHTEEITWVALAPDGTRFATASGDRSVRIWDINNDRALQVLPDHPGPLTCAAFSPDGRRLISVGGFPEVLVWDVWDLARVKVVSRFPVPNGCWCLAFGPAVRGTFAVSPGGLIWLFTSNDPNPRVFHGHTSDVHGLAISPSGALIASGSFDGTVRLWDIANARELRCFNGHLGVVNCVAFSPDGWRIISAGSADRVLRLWDTETGQQLCRMEGHTDNVPCVAISPDGHYALSGGADCNLILWKLPG
jgi:WD40 repeat protein